MPCERRFRTLVIVAFFQGAEGTRKDPACPGCSALIRRDILLTFFVGAGFVRWHAFGRILCPKQQAIKSAVFVDSYALLVLFQHSFDIFVLVRAVVTIPPIATCVLLHDENLDASPDIFVKRSCYYVSLIVIVSFCDSSGHQAGFITLTFIPDIFSSRAPRDSLIRIKPKPYFSAYPRNFPTMLPD